MTQQIERWLAFMLRNRRADLVLSAGFVIALEVCFVLSNAKRGPVALNVIVLAGMGAALTLRRRAPLGMTFAAFGLASILTIFCTHVPYLITAIPYLMFVAYSLGVFSAQPRASIGIGVGVVTVAILSLVQDHNAGDAVFPTVFFCFLPWLAGRTMHGRLLIAREGAEKAARLETDREERARRAVVDERARIARELHDVVAHSLTVMVIQAGAARRIVEQDPERAAGVARVIKQMSREALDEMRRLVGVMTPDGEPAALAPQPTMQHVDSLVIRARAAGLKVELTIDGERPELPAGVDTSAYRVVQEALVNAIKYAPTARAKVAIRYGETELELDVSDDGGGSAYSDGDGDGAALSGGHGLTGMRERVSLYGGELESGPRDGGGFRIRARFPLAERVPA